MSIFTLLPLFLTLIIPHHTWAAIATTDPAQSAFQQGQFATAIALWEQELPSLTTVPQQIDTLTYLANAYRAIGQSTAAVKALQEALTLAEQHHDQIRQTMVLINLSELPIPPASPQNAQETQRVVDYTKPALEIASRLQHPLLLASALNQFGNLLTSQDSPELAWALYMDQVFPLAKLTLPNHLTKLRQQLSNTPGAIASDYRGLAETLSACETQRSADELQRYHQLQQELETALTAAKQWAEQSPDQAAKQALVEGLFGNWYKIKQRSREAHTAFQQASFLAQWDTYQQALTLVQRGQSAGLKVKILLNLLQTVRGLNDSSMKKFAEKNVPQFFQQAFTLLQTLPPSYDTASHWLTLADLAMTLPTFSASVEVETALTTALTLARQLAHSRLQSMVYGQLGQWQERQRHLDQALQLTRQAVFLAQSEGATDLLYRWQWQLGRVLRANSQETEALSQYQQAVQNLEKLRPAFRVTTTATVFEQDIKPVYLELAELQLRQGLLTEALATIERFKPAELENYFKDDCVVRFQNSEGESAKKNQNRLLPLPPHTAALYPLVFPDHLTLVLTLPELNPPVAIDAPVTEKLLNSLVTRFLTQLDEEASRPLYQLLIRPLSIQLEKHQIDTLVIVPMGSLYQVPFAALHDGQQYLIEKYALAITPGLTLTATTSNQSPASTLLLGGLSTKVAKFPRLCQVQPELDNIQRRYSQVTRLDNDQFAKSQIERELHQRYSMVHFATHAKFGTSASESFILAYDDKITLNELEHWIRDLRSPVELLTLSACETAKGDDWQAALGLAGVAVKAGTRSALGSLWQVNDKAASQLMTEFYQQLQEQPTSSKAKALQQAQLVLLRNHPEYRQKPNLWAGFVLIGQWQ